MELGNWFIRKKRLGTKQSSELERESERKEQKSIRNLDWFIFLEDINLVVFCLSIPHSNLGNVWVRWLFGSLTKKKWTKM